MSGKFKSEIEKIRMNTFVCRWWEKVNDEGTFERAFLQGVLIGSSASFFCLDGKRDAALLEELDFLEDVRYLMRGCS